jgi:hypothetical protein
MGISSDRQFLGLVGRVLPGWFPHLPEQSQYNRRLRSLVELISAVQLRLARWLDSGGVRLADGTLLGCPNYPGSDKRSAFAGFARYGYAKSRHRFVWGCALCSSQIREACLSATRSSLAQRRSTSARGSAHGHAE